jgi:hypothetical protein
MNRSARPGLFDTTVGFDDPLEILLACHRRIERFLDILVRLHDHIVAKGVDPEASLAAQSLLRYFTRSALDHQDDEEKDLLPLIESRIRDGDERVRFALFRARLEEDHRSIEAIWSRLRKPLEGIAEGFTRTLPSGDVHAFAAAYRSHIEAEETALQEFFGRWLTAADRAALGRSMSARRSVTRPGLPRA